MLSAVPPPPDASMFPRRKFFQWIEQGNGLWARVGSDGEVIMWKDDTTRDVWLAHETPPKKWRKYFKSHDLNGADDAFGAPASAKTIGRLQSALETLSRRVDDHQVATTLDGRMGPLTAAATNRALKVYSSAPANLKTGRLTQAQIMADLTAIISYIEAARGIPAKVSSGIYRPPQSTQYPAGSPGGASMPAPTYYQPTYYAHPGTRPPQYGTAYPPQYAAPRGPGGLPADRATLDIKAFIPAQYDEFRIHPSLPMLLLGGIVIYMVMKNQKKHKE